MNPISKGLSWRFQKHKHLIDSLVFRNAPEFVYGFNPPPLEGDIPVFTFHTALPDWFEEQCLYLAENGYQTLSADQFLHTMTLPERFIKKAIFLTFDDGLKHVWTVAYPLLKKYNLKATCFLIPGCIPEDDHRVRPTLENYWEGKTTLKEVMALGRGSSALATWAEIKIMHESGVIDFQSHTMYHSLVFTSNEIFDFINPSYNTHYYGNIHVPLYLQEGEDVISRDPTLGMPVYFAKPRMSAHRRFFDDEGIRNRCIEMVSRKGADDFFKRRNWRKMLVELCSDYKKREGINERYETSEQRDDAVFQELLTSKKIIEEKLTGKKVTHLCYPWYEAANFAIRASKKAGFKANYFGQLKGRPNNRPGDDAFKIVRVEENFLQRLPGTGRKTIPDIFKKLYDLRSVPQLFWPSNDS